MLAPTRVSTAQRNASRHARGVAPAVRALLASVLSLTVFGLLGIWPLAAASQAATPTSFQVGVNVSGITHYGYGDILRFASASDADADLAALASMRGSLVRVFVGNRFIGDAEAAQRLAKFLQQAATYHVRVVATLIDFYASGFFPQGVDRYYTDPWNGTFLLNHAFFAGGYKERYLPFVRAVVTANRGNPNLYAWEYGNELKDAANPQDLIAFMNDVGATIRGIDPAVPISTGMLNAAHTGLTPSMLYPLLSYADILSIHSYGGTAGREDLAWAQANGKRAFIGEYGLGRTDDRSGEVASDVAYWKAGGAEAFLQWGFIAKGLGDNGNGDRLYGMDTIWHMDYDGLASVYEQAVVSRGPTATPTASPSATPSPTSTSTATRTATATLTATLRAAVTLTPPPSASVTLTVAATPSATATPSSTPIATATPTITPTPKATATATATLAATLTPTQVTAPARGTGGGGGRRAVAPAAAAVSTNAGGGGGPVLLPDTPTGLVSSARTNPPTGPIATGFAPAALTAPPSAAPPGPTSPADTAQPDQATPPAPIASSAVQAAIDPALGGALTSPDAVLSLVVPAREPDFLNVALTTLSPNPDGTLPQGNLQIGSQMYVLNITDSANAAVTAFDPPLTLNITPPPALTAAVGGELSQISVQLLDPVTGSLMAAPVTVNPDGTLSVSLVALGSLSQSPGAAPPAPTSPADQLTEPTHATPPADTAPPDEMPPPEEPSE
jgi:hypothetical protein